MFTRSSDAPLKILLAVEDSGHSAAGVNLLTHMTWPEGTVVHILATVPEYLPKLNPAPEMMDLVDEAVEIMRWRDWAAAKILVTRTAATLKAHQLTVETEIGEGRLVAALQQQIAAIEVDLVVIGAKTLGETGEFMLEPVAYTAAQAGNCALLIARPSDQVRPLNTILAVDNSREAWRAVEFLCNLSPPQWAKVTVVHVAEEEVEASIGMVVANGAPAPTAALPFSAATEACTARVINRLHESGAQVWRTICSGPSAEAILSAAATQEADLIIIGGQTQAPRVISGLAGLTRHVVKNAPCSVLTV